MDGLIWREHVMVFYREGVSGSEILKLQEALRNKGFSPGSIDGDFGPGTEAAVIAFQKSEGLLADGIAGPATLSALNETNETNEITTPEISVSAVSIMFPYTNIGNIKTNLAFILKALEDDRLNYKPMILMALATIRAETESFMPISEGKSRYNTSPNGHPFDLYDNRKDLGNLGEPDGVQYKGRGFIQLTGRSNYQMHGKAIGMGNQLIESPELANKPDVAAKLLSSFLKNKERRIKEALLDDDLKRARRYVNGGSHGLDRFSEAFRIGERLIPS